MSEQQRQNEQHLPPDLALLLDALRSDFSAQLSNVKLWGSLAMLGGGTVGGIVGAFFAPQQTQATVDALRGFLPLF